MNVNEELPVVQRKSIFVISPIAKPDDTGFDYTDLFLNEIVIPAARAVGGFEHPIRADRVSAHGSITAQVVRDIIAADVCVADLTHRNPNVMYEVAIAHAADKPVILLQQEDGGPPFDFADERVIQYSVRADLANQARDRLRDFLKNVDHEQEDSLLNRTLHPVRVVFRDLQTVKDASDPQQAILEKVDRLAETIGSVEKELGFLGALARHPSRSSTEPARASTFADEYTAFDRVIDLGTGVLSSTAMSHLHALRGVDVASAELKSIEQRLRRLFAGDDRQPGRADIAAIEEMISRIPPF